MSSPGAHGAGDRVVAPSESARFGKGTPAAELRDTHLRYASVRAPQLDSNSPKRYRGTMRSMVEGAPATVTVAVGDTISEGVRAPSTAFGGPPPPRRPR